MTEQRAFARWLRQRMDTRFLTSGAFARQLGLSVATVHAWRRGESTPSTANLPALAKALDVSLDELTHALADQNRPAAGALMECLPGQTRGRTSRSARLAVILPLVGASETR